MLPVFDSLEAAIESLFGKSVSVAEERFVPGGDANEAKLLRLSTGEPVFMKSNRLSNESTFIAEAEGIEAISETKTIRTPKVLCRGRDVRRGVSFLLMEYLFSTERIPDFWEIFAEELCAMHRADTAAFVPGGVYGFRSDNTIGAGAQCNTPRDSWRAFFAECRLEPQFRKAERYFDPGMMGKIHRLLERTDGLLTEPPYPSLLHGDLWSGNFVVGNDGKAWLIDPAVYVGHAEADLAMTELFGGFSGRFYDTYRQVSGLDTGYEDRRDLYNLYHLLNHLNLFGRSYYSSVVRIVDRYAG